MARVLLLIMLAPIGFAAIRLGWPWAIAVLTLATPIYAFVLLKDAPSRVKTTFIVTAFVLQALLLAWGLQWSLGRLGMALASNAGAGAAYQFTSGSDVLRNFWAIIGGLAIAAGLFGLLLGVVYLQNRRQTTRNGSLSRTMHYALGTMPAKWQAQGGQLTTLKAPKSPRPALTGPGEVNVQRGHALVLEKEGVVTEVLPAGVHWVHDQERLAMLVPLYGQGDRVVIRDATTRDGLQIAELELAVFHKVYSDDATPQIGDGKFVFNDDIIRNRVWSASGNTWEAAVRAVTERQARDLIAECAMEELVALSGEKRGEFKKELEARVNKVTLNMGISVTITGIGTINAPDLAAEKLMAAWCAAKDREMALAQATLQNRIITETATARADSLRTLVGAMNETLEKPQVVRDLLAMSFVERMERVETEPGGSGGQDFEALSRLLLVEALRGFTDRVEPRPTTDP